MALLKRLVPEGGIGWSAAFGWPGGPQEDQRVTEDNHNNQHQKEPKKCHPFSFNPDPGPPSPAGSASQAQSRRVA